MPTEVYVDPSINADSGTGTLLDPFGDLEYAIRQTTFDTTNGTRVNIKSGTAEVSSGANSLDVALDDTSVSAAWSPSRNARAYFQGYTSAAGDGGVATIDMNDQSWINDSAKDGFVFRDLDIQNPGAALVSIRLDDWITIINCKIEGYIWLGSQAHVTDNYFYRGDSTGTSWIVYVDGGYVARNFVDSTGGTAATTSGAIRTFNGPGIIEHNVILCDQPTSSGIQVAQNSTVRHNSIYNSAAGTASGIFTRAASNIGIYEISNNLIEGWSGTGGEGILFSSNGQQLSKGGGNSFFNCTTLVEFGATSAFIIDDDGGNEILTASPFTDAASGDFTPVDTGSVFTSYPSDLGNGDYP